MIVMSEKNRTKGIIQQKEVQELRNRYAMNEIEVIIQRKEESVKI